MLKFRVILFSKRNSITNRCLLYMRIDNIQTSFCILFREFTIKLSQNIKDFYVAWTEMDSGLNELNSQLIVYLFVCVCMFALVLNVNILQ